MLFYTIGIVELTNKKQTLIKKELQFNVLQLFCGEYGIRTRDLLTASQTR